MQDKMLRKGLVLAVVVLFIGMSIVHSTDTIAVKKSTTPTTFGNTLNVGGSISGNYTRIHDAIDYIDSQDSNNNLLTRKDKSNDLSNVESSTNQMADKQLTIEEQEIGYPVNNNYNPSLSDMDDSWWDNNWSYRKEITIDHAMIDVNLTYFPILFDNTSSDYIKAQANGDDFVFVDNTSTTKFHHEIESFNESGNNRLIAWVNVTNLSNTTDTTLFMYYGNAACSNQENITGTWNTNYKMVQHLNETSGSYHDSTKFGNNGTLTDVDSDSVRGANGKIGKAVHLNGDADYIDCGGNSSMGSTTYWTISGWVNFDDLTTQILWNRDITSDFAHGISTAGDVCLVGYSADSRNLPGMSSVLNSSTWYHWTITCNDINNHVRFYLNGVNQTLLGSSSKNYRFSFFNVQNRFEDFQ